MKILEILFNFMENYIDSCKNSKAIIISTDWKIYFYYTYINNKLQFTLRFKEYDYAKLFLGLCQMLHIYSTSEIF